MSFSLYTSAIMAWTVLLAASGRHSGKLFDASVKSGDWTSAVRSHCSSFVFQLIVVINFYQCQHSHPLLHNPSIAPFAPAPILNPHSREFCIVYNFFWMTAFDLAHTHALCDLVCTINSFRVLNCSATATAADLVVASAVDDEKILLTLSITLRCILILVRFYWIFVSISFGIQRY